MDEVTTLHDASEADDQAIVHQFQEKISRR
jgi:hypothetical protein